MQQKHIKTPDPKNIPPSKQPKHKTTITNPLQLDVITKLIKITLFLVHPSIINLRHNINISNVS